MWSLLHDTDQPRREMLSTDQSPRDLWSLRLWSVLSISLINELHIHKRNGCTWARNNYYGAVFSDIY